MATRTVATEKWTEKARSMLSGTEESPNMAFFSGNCHVEQTKRE
jgi:hypothetical protein